MQVNKKILVVDDSAVNREFLNEILAEDYYIVNAENGYEALKILENAKNQIDAVLLDIIMPVMSGYEFLETVRKIPRFSSLPIVVMTGFENEKTEIRSLEMGATDFLVKPYKPTVVKQRLKNLLLLKEAAAIRNTNERDPKTGLYNREGFYQAAEKLISDNPDKEYYIMCADIERFKVINDLFGVEEGDKLLRFLGNAISKYLNPWFGIGGRLTADNFAICYLNQQGFGDKMMSVIRESLRAYPLETKVIVRFGIYRMEDTDVAVSTMCDRANLAIETIKGNYRQYYAYYNEAHRIYLVEEQTIINDMHTALREKQFKVLYQPKYNICTGKIIGAEALVRWEHPKNGLLQPGKFISIFEKNGFITNVDIFIWEEVCKWIRKWIDEGNEPVPISVNVSRVDIYNPDLCNIIEGIVEQNRIPKGLLELEITETAYTDNPEQLIKVVDKLKALEYKVQMDDFGTGYSSLNMLNDVPVDVLKIDMKFIQDSRDNNRGAAILGFIFNLAKKMELDIVAEGIETKEQVKFLKGLGCKKGQGFYYAKPMSIADFEERLLYGVEKGGRTQSVYAASAGDETLEQIRHQQEEIKQQLECLDSLYSMTPLGVVCISTNTNLKILNYNKAAWEIFGYQRKYEFEQRIVKGFKDLLIAEDVADLVININENPNGENPLEFVHHVKKMDGSIGLVEGTFIANGKPEEGVYVFKALG